MNRLEKIIQEVLKERPGLWANIRAKRERGEAPARKGSKAYKTSVKAGKEELRLPSSHSRRRKICSIRTPLMRVNK